MKITNKRNCDIRSLVELYIGDVFEYKGDICILLSVENNIAELFNVSASCKNSVCATESVILLNAELVVS